ncbi:hypothetical protein BRC88_04955 [Halobacteriales archaeon QS_4_69_225]|nr:MAG: hypothetical protein BRC88_04955 [Halobacteriales archaeon QS_4_69_225]
MERTPATATALSVAVVALLCVAVVPAAAHVSGVEADDQRSADGTLRLEWEFADGGSWVVVRADDGGEPGEVLGYRRATDETAFRTDTTVAVNDGAWSEVAGSRELWVVLHSEAGGERFDPEEDPMETAFGEPAGSRLTVERAAGATNVAAQGFGAQTSTDGTVAVRRAELAEDGYLAIHAVNADSSASAGDEDIGEAVGVVELSAGVHDNVTVELDEGYLSEAESETLLAAVVHAGGDEFGADATAPVTAGGAPVSTVFGVELRTAGAATPTPTPAESSLVTTAADAGGSPTATPTATGTDGDGAGVGAVWAAVAVALAAGLAVLRRR